jgi:hypothetical protein
MFQIISDFYIPYTQSGEEKTMELENSNTRALSILKKIELSKGYENYRK